MSAEENQRKIGVSQMHASSVSMRVSLLTAMHSHALMMANIASRELESANLQMFNLEQTSANTAFISETIAELSVSLQAHISKAESVLKDLKELEDNFQEQIEDDQNSLGE